MAEKLIDTLKEYWPILAVIGAGLLAWGGTQMRIQAIQDDISEIKAGAERETRQWQKIAENSDNISVHERRLDDMGVYFSPQAIQEYGEVKAIVRANSAKIDQHLRDHRE